MNDRFEAALEYLRQGWHVIPLNPGQKWITTTLADRLGWDSDQPTCTEADIRRWFEVEPGINIGIRMAGSGLTVVDVDDADGFFAWLEQHDLPNVPWVKTARGSHWYFAAQKGDTCGTICVPDSAGLTGVGCIGDFLAPTPLPWRPEHAAYVVAPPSVVNDHVYYWVTSVDACTLIAVPDWIREGYVMPDEPLRSWFDEPEEDGREYDDEWYEEQHSVDYVSDDDLPDDEHVQALDAILDELLAQRYPPGSDGPPDDLDWGGLYVDAEEILAERERAEASEPEMPEPYNPDEEP